MSTEEPETITVTLTRKDKTVLLDCLGQRAFQLATHRSWPLPVRQEAVKAVKEVAAKLGLKIH